MDRTTGLLGLSHAIARKSSFVIATILSSNSIRRSYSQQKLALTLAPVVFFADLTRTQIVISSVTLDLPGPGVVVLNSGGYAI